MASAHKLSPQLHYLAFGLLLCTSSACAGLATIDAEHATESDSIQVDITSGPTRPPSPAAVIPLQLDPIYFSIGTLTPDTAWSELWRQDTATATRLFRADPISSGSGDIPQAVLSEAATRFPDLDLTNVWFTPSIGTEVLSPDGASVVFTVYWSWRGDPFLGQPVGFPRVFLLDVQTSGMVELTDSVEELGYDWDWSPSGHSALFTVQLENDTGQIYREIWKWDFPSGGQTKVAFADGAVWVSAGESIAIDRFVPEKQTWEVCIRDLATNDEECPLRDWGPISDLAWDPVGSRLLIAGGGPVRGLYELDIETSEVRHIDLTGAWADTRSPRPSPDGRWLTANASRVAGEDDHLLVADPSGRVVWDVPLALSTAGSWVWSRGSDAILIHQLHPPQSIDELVVLNVGTGELVGLAVPPEILDASAEERFYIGSAVW